MVAHDRTRLTGRLFFYMENSWRNFPGTPDQARKGLHGGRIAHALAKIQTKTRENGNFAFSCGARQGKIRP
jgi:hypothetical protein